MATDKPGVMAFLNPEIYERLVAFKETQRLRSLSHAVELALGEYFGVAITPITLHPTSSAQPLKSSETLTAKVELLIIDHKCLYQAVLHLQHMTAHLLVQAGPTLPAFKAPCEHLMNFEFSPAPLTFAHSSLNTQLGNQDKTCQVSVPLTENSDDVISAARGRKGLTGLQLAGRLKVHSSVISRKKQKSYFKEWTSQLDPSGLGWQYSSVSRRFHPVDINN